MTCGAGAALHGETHRLVEHQNVRILVECDRLQESAILLRRRRIIAGRRRFNFQRRDTHRLTGLEPRLWLRPLTIHAHFSFADDALDVAE